jgi:hypothetical protein
MAGELIVERLEGELLVYDVASDEGHRLDPAAAAEFEMARDDVSRREVIRRLTFAGAAAATGAPLVRTIISPTPASAQSPGCSPACTPQTEQCCAATATCCSTFQMCCPPGTATTCCPIIQGTICCAVGSANNCGLPSGAQCSQNAVCCSNLCNGAPNGTCT